MLQLLALMGRRRGTLFAVVVAVVLSLMATVPAGAVEPPESERTKHSWSKPPRERSVPGTAAKKVPPPRLAVTAQAVAAPPKPVWPAPGTDAPAVKAAGVPGTVEVLDRAAAKRAGVNGVVFRVTKSGGPVTVDLDYSGFRHAFGGDYASRLRVIDLKTRKAVPAKNDVAEGRIRVAVDPPKTGARGPGGPAESGSYALTAAASGAVGSFSPTSLAPSATWAVGVQSGDFSWNYPITVPPVPGIAPTVALTYGSGLVDGRTAATNNQASWIGEGFGYEPGFIERTYKPCAEDGHPGKGDLCWDRQAAHIALPGVTGELVKDAASNVWRVADDEGWRVQLLTGANNGDNDGEHWVVTGPDGTEYAFGRTTAAKSAWTVPVFGNDAGEPCNGPSFTASWCRQAYRWTLESVTNLHGDQVSYAYETETNHYGRDNTPSAATEYIRSGRLSRIEYGGRADGGVQSTARILFTSAPRCIPGALCDPSAPPSWPDTPWDLSCSGGSCPAAGPTFWGTQRLAKITTQVRGATGFTDVDSWTLDHVFPATGDGTSSALWLSAIRRTGHAGGTTLALPPVQFDGVRLANRLTIGDGSPPMNKWRLTDVHNETGGTLRVGYAPDLCDPAALPRQDQNARKCFPSNWLPAGNAAPALHWFTKYVVTKVEEIDRVGGSPAKTTRYEYIEDDPAWSHDSAELVPGRFKTWGSWRGYQRVKVRTGEAGGAQTLTEHVFSRGMHGEPLLDGSRRTVKFSVLGKEYEDKPGLAGFARETITRDPVSGAEITAEYHEPWLSDPTAVRQRESGPLEARILKVTTVQTRTALPGGTSRTAETRTEYDGYGSPVEVHDKGDITVPGDDVCTTTTYTRNTTAWIVDRPSRVLTAAAACPATGIQDPAPADVLTDERSYYDGATAFGTAPVKGDETRTEELSSWSGAQPVYTTVRRAAHDQHGRITDSWDALGAKTTTAYQPAVGGPLARTTVTNPLGHVSVTETEPARGLVTAVVDADNRRAVRAYDALGRLTAGWQPGRPATASPTVKYEYTTTPGAPTAVTARKLLGGGDYAVSHTLYDGLLRQRQTQEPSPQGGRIVTDTVYDAAGRVRYTNGAYHNTAAPAPTLLVTNPVTVPAQKAYEYDGAGRTTAEILRSSGMERHRTTWAYQGDRVHEDPPAGGTPATRITDPRGRLLELRQYTGDAPTGAHLTTRYSYTKAGKRATVTDPAGNVWRFGYDVRGRQITAEDPDKGTATMTYDDKDRLTSTTDARGTTLAHAYDALDRRTGLFEGSTAGAQLAEWTYDTAPLGTGRPAANIRHSGGAAYRTEITGYNASGLPTGTAVTIPAREGALAGRYETTAAYNQAGQISGRTLPAAGGLPAESLATGYTPTGLTDTLVSELAPYVTGTGYTGMGRLGERFMGGRVLRTYAYDPATGLVNGLRTELDTGAVAMNITIGHDAAGNIVSTDDAASNDRQCFRQDSLGRLTEAWTTTAACPAGPSTAVLGGPAPYWHVYGYDTAGNRTRETHRTAAGDTVRDYTYPAAGTAGAHRLRSVTGGGTTGQYGYDAAGNTTSRPGQTLTWNPEGRLSQVAAGAVTTGFEYDADGNRLLRRDPGSTTLYLGDTELKLTTATGAVTGTRYYTVDGDDIAVRTPAGLSWLTEDHAGTADASIDSADLTTTVRRHLPYGAPRGAQPANWPGERGFVGGTKDATTGLTHLGAREYDPETGAFLSADPILNAEDPQQLHGYAYAGNSPVSKSDPTGLTAQPVTGDDPGSPADWDSSVTGYRTGGDSGFAALYANHGAAAARGEESRGDESRGDAVLAFAAEVESGRGGWDPKVPDGYTNPPGSQAPRPTPGAPAPAPGGGGSGTGTGSSREIVDPDSQVVQAGDPDDFFHYGWDVEFRPLWEYDKCKPWNPCEDKKKPPAPNCAKGKKKGDCKGGGNNTGKGGNNTGKGLDTLLKGVKDPVARQLIGSILTVLDKVIGILTGKKTTGKQPAKGGGKKNTGKKTSTGKKKK
ncbi:RHS repeat-associated core domain-containing protein [Streptomyces tsukubensis]